MTRISLWAASDNLCGCTGEELWVTRMEANGHATPMTFLGKRTHKQIVVIAAGGSGLLATEDVPIPASDALDAFALPEK